MGRRKQAELDPALTQAEPQGQPPPTRAESNLSLSPPAEMGTRQTVQAHAPTTTSPSEGDGTAKKLPTYKVGPILTDRHSAVECAVWATDVPTDDGKTFTVHAVTVQATLRAADGTWKPTKGFRGSQIYAVLYGLQRASDFILSQRDPANQCPF